MLWVSNLASTFSTAWSITAGRRGRRTAATTPAPGAARTVFNVTPTAEWHPGFSVVTVDGNNCVTNASDLQGTSSTTSLPNTSTWTGPQVGTDLLGRKFWFTNGNQYLDIAKGGVGGPLDTVSTRGFMFAVVARVHRSETACPFLGAGSWFQATQVNISGTLAQAAATGGAMNLRQQQILTNTLTNKEKMIPGSQLQVIAFHSTATATRFYINNDVATGGAAFLGTFTGAELFRTPGTTASGAEPVTVAAPNFGPGAFMDVYDVIFWKGALTNAQADANVAALVSNWSIPQLVNNLIVEGDSIIQGLPRAGDPVATQVFSHYCIGMAITTPGDPRAMPGSWRVLNVGSSGATCATLTTRRDTALGVFTMNLPGRNVVVFEIGVNDAGLPHTAAQIYTDIVALINTTTTGYSQRGYEIRVLPNIATGNGTFEAVLATLRTSLRNIAQFRTDTGVANLGLVEVQSNNIGAVFPFVTVNGTYYQTDNLHPNVVGTSIMGRGGDTDTNSIPIRVLASS